MKKILLASTAIIGFAGAAAADVSWSGSANVGIGELNGGSGDLEMYQNISVVATMSGETDNGLSFGASLTVRSGDDLDLDAGDLNDDGTLSDVSFGNIFISGEFGKLTFDRDGIDNLKDDDASHDIMYEYSAGDFSFALTYDVDQPGGVTAGAGEDWSAKIGYSMDAFGATLWLDSADEFDLELTYAVNDEVKLSFKHESDGDGGDGENTIKAAYDNGTLSASLAISDVANEWDLGLGYKMDGLTLAANYGDSDGGDEWDLSASYDLGGGLTVKAMTNETEAYYIGLAMSF